MSSTRRLLKYGEQVTSSASARSRVSRIEIAFGIDCQNEGVHADRGHCLLRFLRLRLAAGNIGIDHHGDDRSRSKTRHSGNVPP
jgi:hypothetical protein